MYVVSNLVKIKKNTKNANILCIRKKYQKLITLYTIIATRLTISFLNKQKSNKQICCSMVSELFSSVNASKLA